MRTQKRPESGILTASAAVRILKDMADIGIVNAHRDKEDLLRVAELIELQEERLAIALEAEYKETDIRFP